MFCGLGLLKIADLIGLHVVLENANVKTRHPWTMARHGFGKSGKYVYMLIKGLWPALAVSPEISCTVHSAPVAVAISPKGRRREKVLLVPLLERVTTNEPHMGKPNNRQLNRALVLCDGGVSSVRV